VLRGRQALSIIDSLEFLPHEPDITEGLLSTGARRAEPCIYRPRGSRFPPKATAANMSGSAVTLFP
jgi:hypothetical protein